MRYKKTWFNYILWGLYGLLACVCLTAHITLGCTLLKLPGTFYFMSTAAAALLLGLAVFLPGRFLAGKLSGKSKRTPAAWNTIDWLCLALAGGVTLAVRFASLRGFALERIAQTVSFRQAAEAAGTVFGITAWNVEGMYTWLLTVLFSFLGTKEMAAAVFQIFLQAAGVVLIYAALHTLASRSVAVTVCLIFSVWPAFVNKCGEASPQSLLLLLEGALLFLTAWLLRYLKRNGQNNAEAELVSGKKTGSGKRVAMTVLLLASGAVLGAACYGSLYLANVFLVAVLALLYLEQKGRSGKTAAAQAGILSLGVLGGFGGMLLLERFSFGADVGELLGRWIFWNVPGQTSLWERFASADTLYFCLPLLGLAFFYMLGFFDQRGGLGVIWILPLLFLSVCALFRDEPLYQPLNLLLWAVMAGMGIHSVCCYGGPAQEALLEEPERTRRKQKAEKAAKQKRKMRKIQRNESWEPDGEEELQHVILPGQPLDNPLPGPKKHVRKDLDYAFEPEDSNMFFEIDDLDENADFDLKD